jgi:hypothetical protein
MERSLFSILSPGNRIWSVLSYDLPHVYSALIEETDQFTLLDRRRL